MRCLSSAPQRCSAWSAGWWRTGWVRLRAAGESGRGLGARPGLAEGFWHALQVLRSIWLWIVVGVVASAAITQWVPAASLARLGDSSPVLVYASVLLLSIPLYVCATASVPIAAALVAGGLPAGSALVFLVAGPATNVATIGAVAKTFGRPVLVVYLVTLIAGSMVLGMSFDHLIPAAESLAHHHHERVSWWVWLCSGGLTMVFAYFAVESLMNARGVGAAPMTKGWNVSVEGMTCGGCSSWLERVLNAHEAVDGAQVDLAAAKATVAGSISAEALVEVITGAGFTRGGRKGSALDPARSRARVSLSGRSARRHQGREPHRRRRRDPGAPRSEWRWEEYRPKNPAAAAVGRFG